MRSRVDWVIVGIVAAVSTASVLWTAWALYSPEIAAWWLRNGEATSAEAGSWGDSFGAFNALFSALGFTAVLTTLLLQGRSLAQQQKDQHTQRFETTFFHMLKLIRECREQVRFKHSRDYRVANPRAPASVLTSHAAFRAAYREMRFWVQKKKELNTITKDDLANIYSVRIHNRFESTFGAYYRLVYTALDRVRADNHLSKEDKDELGNLVRAQFTSFEAALAGCNGLNKFAKDFDTIAVRFRLLKYARRGVVYEELRKFYPAEAFLGRSGLEMELIEPEDDDDTFGTDDLD